MPLAIVAGLPQYRVRRTKGYELRLTGWDVRRVDSRGEKADNLRSCWQDVLLAADEAPADGAHILAFLSNEAAIPEYESTVHQRHRLRWFNLQSIEDFGTPQFDKTMKEMLEFEAAWRDSIRPLDEACSLVLPQRQFAAATHVKRAWERAFAAVTRREIQAVTGMLREFERLHYHRRDGDSARVWYDRHGMRFDHRANRHGIIPKPKRWKFTYRVAEGFHYDVHPTRVSLTFEFICCDGTSKKFTKNANVDTHGHLRGGS